MSTFMAIDPSTGHEFAELPETTPEQVSDMANVARQMLAPEPRVARAADTRQGALEPRPRDRGRDTRSSPSSRPATPASRSSRPRPTSTATVRYLDYYAGSIERLEGRQIPLGPDVLDYTLREPWGVCAQIIPWNYPLQVTARCAAPALAAGNAVIVKPSELASITPLRFAELAEEAGVPRGLIQVATGDGADRRRAGAATPPSTT